MLRSISFDVYQGEFFGIVGRNGSGKSTLLKLIASIYRADRGRIRIAGRLAPFLELGVGFNGQMPAYENVVMNGVMMGLAPDAARARYEEIIDFAGLRGHTDLQLKNYSSGMKVRLAFAVMTHVDADVLLVDEVLAVGDAEFQEKCDQVFRRMHRQGRTIILVTHSMPTIGTYCERAMLLHDGAIDVVGDPTEVGNRYLELNMRAAAAAEGGVPSGFAERFASVIANPPVRVTDYWLAGPEGRATSELAPREPIELRAVLEVEREIEEPGLQFKVDDPQGRTVLTGGGSAGIEPRAVARAGDRFEITARVDNHLAGGVYVLSFGVSQRGPEGASEPATPAYALRFEVAGETRDGIVVADHEVVFERALPTEAGRS